MPETMPPPITVELVAGDVPPFRRTFTAGFCIGRGVECDLRLETEAVSRRHTEIVFESGTWIVRDLKSTNGTFLQGERIESAPLPGEAEVQLGRKGPTLRLSFSATDRPGDRGVSPSAGRAEYDAPRPEESRGSSGSGAHRPGAIASTRPDSGAGRPTTSKAGTSPTASRTGTTRPDKSPGRKGADPAIDHYIQHYMKTGDDPDAGEHTIMIRKAFATVQTKQRRRYGGIIAAVVVLAVLLGGWGIYQGVQLSRQTKAAAALFYEMKGLDLQIAQLRAVVEESGNAAISDQLDKLETSRRAMSRRYDGYVKDLGVYRKLNENEKVIYRMARVFNESEFGMPAEFADSVLHMIHTYWQTPAGRSRFTRAVTEAEDNGYTDYIVRVMRRNGLPPQLFYLALQESNFNTKAIGPETRWGRAKGMWQFIPATAQRYGLDPGPYANEKMVDPGDERHDFQASTKAAARYLQDVYGTLAQASGLLVVASYNWGEHRIINRLEKLSGPQTIPAEALAGIPEDPSARNYWSFLGQYRDRMPRETKDYVLKIFSAAVIGENPRQFGFDMDNPLKPYLEAQDPE
jgi:membrane-bound lytic murein transglycosylase D